ncbi:alpha/beta family hydrolase [Phenylobacterium montanum]|uniref:KANL3/Tex30 alpha/beta hydrolase-like domain-containing protein n=1 Tax=Phenylobacterium montanum TaxID=2823693 RepID=A0A975FWP8_9CAUL|nr:alpha/beta family hydrolase [Caulobacter sp. S6]QUD86541.1 hypothetical protein KCG34_15765 [Caulobacter sp. S6]
MDGTVFYLGGASYPADRQVEDVLRARFVAEGASFVGHREVLGQGSGQGRGASVEEMVAALRRVVTRRRGDGPAILAGRSSGAHAATLFAAERPVTAVVCYGYPFKNPSFVLQPGRFAHLAALTTPTLILQGMRDVYGGLGLTEDYALSPAVGLHFFDGSHEADFDAPGCAHLPDLIVNFASGGWRSPGHRGARFDEADYLARHPDVAAAVAEGRFRSGADHFQRLGRDEGRRFRLLPK